MRFGRDPTTITRPSSSYFRLGRSTESQSKRSKREVYSSGEEKRNSNFVRFGRTHNFMRFGRMPAENEESKSDSPKMFKHSNLEIFKEIQEAKLLQALSDLAMQLKDAPPKCQRLVQ